MAVESYDKVRRKSIYFRYVITDAEVVANVLKKQGIQGQ